METALKENPDIQREDYIYKETCARFFRYKKKFGETNETAADLMGKPPELVSKYLKNDLDSHAKMVIQGTIRNFLNHNERSNPLPEGPVFSTTTVSRDIWEVCQWVQKSGVMGLITGPAGVGKTMTISKYKKKHETALVLTCGVTVKCLGAILEAVAEKLGIKLYGRTNSIYLDRIGERLRETHRLLIFDEAHFLDWSAYEAIRQLWDLSQTGIVYVGQQRVLAQMRGKRNTYLYDQIFSRIAVRRQVGGDISRDDVKLIAGSFCPELDRRSIDFLHQKATGDGHFRTLTNVLKLTVQMSEMSQKPINLSLLQQAFRFLMA
ncbi:MAG: AAA family ATPase [Thermodesulfobacteriota bacterium]|nr:AAA family ATPase [Thermodesulfobacteriota bacterium]